MDLVDKINTLSKQQGISQKGIADTLGTYPANISDILNRKNRKFNVKDVKKLSNLFNVSVSYLLDDTADKPFNFGALLKKAREDKKMSQQELADNVGIKRAAISNYERNLNTPRYSNIQKMEKALGVGFGYFDNIEDDYNPTSSFSKSLRDIMTKKGLTGEVLANILEVNTSTVIHWSNGRRFPSEKAIVKLSRVLNVTISELFGEAIG